MRELTGEWGMLRGGEGSGGGAAGGVLASVELAVLRASATGKATAEVADELGLDVELARAHLARAIVALGARSKLEAVVLALRAGWIELDPT